MSPRRRFSVVIRAAVSLAVAAILANPPAYDVTHARQETREAATPIEPGKKVTGVLNRDQIARYSLVLAADRAATIVVGHQNIDVAVRVLARDAAADVEVVSDGPDGELRLRIVASRSEPHVVEVAPAYSKNP